MAAPKGSMQVIGVPDDATDIGDAQAVVIALKSRTNPVDEAVEWSVQALKWLREKGATQFFFKYCSTFDSTEKGNIGPVANALLGELDDEFALVCPAFPENGRTIYQGHLFVFDQLLSESPMKDHPLTPMRDANLVRLMQNQSAAKTGLIDLNTVRAGSEATNAALRQSAADGHRYAIVDATTDEDLRIIGEAAAHCQLITGGSGIAMELPHNYLKTGLMEQASVIENPRASGRSLVICGSCSQATRGQIDAIEDQWPNRKVDIHRIAQGEPEAEAIIEWAMNCDSDLPVVIYASSDPDEVRANQGKYGMDRAGEMIEATLSEIAEALVAQGFGRLVVAGGESSGAVVSALGIKALRIGAQIAPGVPWTEAQTKTSKAETSQTGTIALALKSGNFGQVDFFAGAFAALGTG